MNKTVAQQKKKRDIRTFEADADVAEVLEAGILAGRNQRELINACVRYAGPHVLSKLVSEMRAAATRVEKIVGRPAKESHDPKAPLPASLSREEQS